MKARRKPNVNHVAEGSYVGQSFHDAPAAGEPAPASDAVSLTNYFNRDLSWLEFNSRVLRQAEDDRTPLLERVNFLSICNSNLDEFYMKRVGLLLRQAAAGRGARKPDGLTPRQQLRAIRRMVEDMHARAAAAWGGVIQPALAAKGVFLHTYEDLTDAQRQWCDQYFHSKVFPVLTPLAVDPGHPFPFISNLSTSLGVVLRYEPEGAPLFARVKIPEVLPPLVRINGHNETTYDFIPLVELIRHNLADLFPGMIIASTMLFRVTRNADVEQDPEDVEDLCELVEEELRQRRFEPVVRLETPAQTDPWICSLLMQELELADEQVYPMPALLDYTALKAIASLRLPGLRFEPWTPVTPKALAEPDTDIFSVIRQNDVLLHHPYESFNASIERFVRSAAEDPAVLAIKITLYRTGMDSPFIPALIGAAEAGKQVVALVEVKARFDEARNIELGQALEKAGVHVVYGMVGLKTHTKTTLVVRQESDGLVCYSHIGTGNYHVVTAQLYTDVSLLTCREPINSDLIDLFHFLTGRSQKRQYKQLLVAPVNMTERFLEMIEREIANQKAGRPARIVAKMNSLEAESIIEALYRASQAGVSIDLIVRGFCCLRPGVKGLSETIRVTSIIGRFLEHARIFHFAAGQADPLAGEFYIGSADWMHRNLEARVEVITPVDEASARRRLWEILQVQLADQRQVWELGPDGTYVQRRPAEGATPAQAAGTHATLMQLARQANQV
ncbi:MAG: polyphosphate kinase 1 [Planctomycetota bacterium]|nr:polyphosphate kinase 1 [Planctomycetota bacterium]